MSTVSPPVLPASVIIPSRGRPALLVQCVESILAGDELPREIVVVDQSEQENTTLAAMGTVRGCSVRYRRVDTKGVSAARNEACAVAAEEALVFTDDDIVVAPAWLGTITRSVLADPSSTLISGRVLFIDRAETGGFAPSLIEAEEPRTYEGRVWSDVLFSNNMAFSRAIYERLGPFDPRLGVGSPYRAATDNDYCFRALEAGLRIRYDPYAIVYHQAWRPKRRYTGVYWNYGVGQGACFAKHAHLHDRYTLIRLRNAVVRHGRAALQVRSDGWWAASGEAAYAIGLVYGAARWSLLERLLGR